MLFAPCIDSSRNGLVKNVYNNKCLIWSEGQEEHICRPRYINEKTPVISRSLFINQKTNSHDKLLYLLNYNFPAKNQI